MGSLKSGIFAIALSSLVGAAAVVGCSADGATGITDNVDPTVPDDNRPLAPTSGSSGDNSIPDAGRDASKKDSGPKAEAGVDAGPPPPVEGAPCPVIEEKGTKPCGMCGKAEILCRDDGTGKGKWDVYGACGGQTGACEPGTSVTEDCGNCGKVVKTCSQFCAYSTSACTGQPANSCKPGTLEYSGASCPVASTFRNRTCGAACTWSAFSGTCEKPVNEIVLDIGGAVGAVTTKKITFSAARTGPRITGSCPAASVSALTNYPYQYVEIHNPSATKPAKVTVYLSKAGAGPVIDTVMTAYGTAIQPIDDVSRKACRDGVNDQSSPAADLALTGNANFSILKAVAIPAGGSVLVWAGSYYEIGEADFEGVTYVTTGDININTKVELL